MSRRRAVITGLGPITSIGEGCDEVLSSLKNHRSGISRITAFDPSEFGLRARCAGEVKSFDPLRYLEPRRARRLDRFAQMAVASARLAIEDAGLEWDATNPQLRTGISFGTALGGIANAEAQHKKFFQEGPRAVNQLIGVQVFGGSAHANIAIEFGFRGPGTTNSNSCASGTVAVGEAMRYIRDGMADVMIAGGAETPLSPLTFGAFDFISTMSRREPPESCCPFDLRRDGFVMGEGAASLVVEEYEHAKRRGARIYAEVLGYAINNDAFHMTSPLPDAEATMRAMRYALEDARLNPEQIDYINGHASSTRINDATETRAIRGAFGEHAKNISVSGTKSYTAHPLGATGAIEAVICCLAVRERFLPPTLHHEKPDPECDLDVIPNECREASPRYVLSNSFGFGGINSCIVLGCV